MFLSQWPYMMPLISRDRQCKLLPNAVICAADESVLNALIEMAMHNVPDLHRYTMDAPPLLNLFAAEEGALDALIAIAMHDNPDGQRHAIRALGNLAELHSNSKRFAPALDLIFHPYLLSAHHRADTIMIGTDS